MLNRRQFLQSSSVAAASVWIASPAVVRGRDLNSKLQLAAIGCDGKGWSDTKEMSTHDKAQHVAFCDVDLSRTDKVKKLNPDAPLYQDFRELLAQQGDKIDAVSVSTPDHMHAIQAITAMRMGKHVYCQKPLTHTIWEARQMRQAADKQGVITRLGNQIHSHKFYRTAVRVIQDGLIGKVKRVHSWCAATGHGKSGFIARPPQPVEPPASLNWDLWIGVAPMRPFGALHCYHPFGWRDFQAFGNGALGDFGCHILDPVFTALKIEGAPVDCKAVDHTGMNNEVWPAQSQVDYTFPGTEQTVGDLLQITWYDGGRLPIVNDSHVPATSALPRSGSLFIGEQGSLVLPHVGELRLYPEEKFSAKVESADDQNHYHGWVDGCLTGEQPSDGFDYGGRLTEAVLLGNIAYRFKGETLNWDAENLKITNVEAANRWLTRDYRDGWEVKAV
ncbi:MAG: Gfo/Idh/MocA family protein, partial [Planctomycetaceae bacterium]